MKREAEAQDKTERAWDKMNRAQKRTSLHTMSRQIRKSVFGRWRWRQGWHMEEREEAMKGAQ